MSPMKIFVAPKGADDDVENKKRSLLLFCLLGEEHGLDVWQNTALCNGDSGQELVELLVITDSQLQMTGDDTGLLVITSSIASELENLGS